MMWKDVVYRELRNAHLFQTPEHQSRFKELLDCYAGADFFTPGLCKCMYLSCWDDEHFAVMLDMLNQLKLEGQRDLSDMEVNGELLIEETPIQDYQHTVMELSCDFLENKPFDIKSLPEDFDPEGRLIIEKALQAAAVIDGVSVGH